MLMIQTIDADHLHRLSRFIKHDDLCWPKTIIMVRISSLFQDYSTFSYANIKFAINPVKNFFYFIEDDYDDDSYIKLYSPKTVMRLFYHIFADFTYGVFLKNVIEQKDFLKDKLKIFENMLDIFMKRQKLLESSESKRYYDLIYIIHRFIFKLYRKCYIDATMRQIVENFIKNKYPINLLVNEDKCILHIIFNGTYVKHDLYHVEITRNFILLLAASTNNFKHFNHPGNNSPLALAVRNHLHVDIINCLLESGSIINDCLREGLKWRDKSLKSLAAQTIVNDILLEKNVNEKKNYNENYKELLPKSLGNFVDNHFPLPRKKKKKKKKRRRKKKKEDPICQLRFLFY